MKQNDEWWNWREKIIQKEIKKTKQIAIKKIITKLNTKNNFKDTFIFYQGEEREKKKKKKKSTITQLLYGHVYMSRH
jgi:hypothetical protein